MTAFFCFKNIAAATRFQGAKVEEEKPEDPIVMVQTREVRAGLGRS